MSTLDLFLSLLSGLSVGHPLIVTCFPGSQSALTLAFLPSPDFGALLGVHCVPRICHLSFHKILHEEGATYPKVGRPFSMNTMNNMTNNPYSHLLCEYQWVTLQTMKFVQQWLVLFWKLFLRFSSVSFLFLYGLLLNKSYFPSLSHIPYFQVMLSLVSSPLNCLAHFFILQIDRYVGKVYLTCPISKLFIAF